MPIGDLMLITSSVIQRFSITGVMYFVSYMVMHFNTVLLKQMAVDMIFAHTSYTFKKKCTK